ncbi:hypothetical protein [Chroococcidiopsis cubana]|nr:hypothetical protein [Chroococcidiopsis cubana]
MREQGASEQGAGETRERGETRETREKKPSTTHYPLPITHYHHC